jgi:hypothetical protein
MDEKQKSKFQEFNRKKSRKGSIFTLIKRKDDEDVETNNFNNDS